MKSGAGRMNDDWGRRLPAAWLAAPWRPTLTSRHEHNSPAVTRPGRFTGGDPAGPLALGERPEGKAAMLGERFVQVAPAG